MESAQIAAGQASPDEGTGYRVPYHVFTDPGVYAREQREIFRGLHWSYVALEAEIPNPGDFKTTFIGDIPVVVTRSKDGAVNVVENRCAHRGATVCRALRGNAPHLECVYHQWAYELDGKLMGVPFRRGLKGQGGMPKDFNMAAHGLTRLRVETLAGLVFATFAEETPALRDYLGEMATGHIERILNRPIKVLGDQRQYVKGNWKLYAENVRDPYHASLLHLFHTTFGLYRSTQQGASRMDEARRHSAIYSIAASNDDESDNKAYAGSRTFNTEFSLQDMSLLQGRPDFNDGITLVILGVFPNLVLQQISNTLAVRQIVTHGPEAFELVWTHFGYVDDDAEMDAIRLKQANLIGPAGLISMEDGEAVEIVQNAIREASDKKSFIAMGGGSSDDVDHLVSEATIIGFWENYERVVGYDRPAA